MHVLAGHAFVCVCQCRDFNSSVQQNCLRALVVIL